MDPFMLLGVAGMIIILAAFLMINAHKLTADSLTYDVLNFVGSTLLVISAYAERIWPFAILNAVFMVYSLKDILFQDLRHSHKAVRKA